MLTSNTLTTGLNTDVYEKFQPENTYRFALNAVTETREGSLGSISNELGTTICAELPANKVVIGHALTNTENIVLFLFDKATTSIKHEIGIYDPLKCTYTTIGKGPCLNFSDKHQINAITRIRNGCELVVYFTDNYNDYRVANLTDTSDWVVPNTTTISSCSKIKFSRTSKGMCAKLTTNPTNPTQTLVLDSGGQLKIGTYNFAVRYLDAESNPTNWRIITLPVPIADESSKGADGSARYDGGSNVQEEVGYVPATSKAISITLTNIDKSFKFVQFAAIKHQSTDGTITGVDILNPYPVPTAPLATSLTYVYKGLVSEVFLESSTAEVLAENLMVHKVKAHAQLDNRLFIGNVTGPNRDYIGYQRHASKTKVEYVKERTNYAISPNTTAKSSKQATYYFGDGSFLADEVYALGIVYIHSDGTESPVFHIPGRAPDTNIVGTNPLIPTFTNWDTDDITGDPNIINASKLKRWQSYNTATKYNVPYTGTDVSGLMGYYEVADKYPSVSVPCDTHPDGFWGRDANGNLITPNTTPIRHHRMPGHELYNMSIQSIQYKTGIRFTMSTAYPASDIVGHYYVYSDRTNEKTILDKGYLSQLKANLDNDVHEVYATGLVKNSIPHIKDGKIYTPHPTTHQSYLYTSPKINFENTYAVGTYLKLEKNALGTLLYKEHITPTSEKFDKVLDLYSMHYLRPTEYDTPTTFNYKLKWHSFLEKSYVGNNANSVVIPQEGLPIQNLSIHNNWLVISTEAKLQPLVDGGVYGWEGDRSFQVSLKSEIDVFSNLFQINYYKIGNCELVKGDGSLVTTSYAGDIFTTDYELVDYLYARAGNGTVYVTGDGAKYPLECEHNVSFRHGQATATGEFTYFTKDGIADADCVIQFGEYIADKYYEIVQDSDSNFYPETYFYNKSYSISNSIKQYLPPAFNFEYCNECREDYPYRIYCSLADNNESSEDKYRQIRVNNYTDGVSGATGELNDLFINFDKLYALTNGSIFYIPTRPQQLNTDIDSLYIGTGEVFSIPPQQLKTTDYHFGGSRHFKSRQVTEYGTFYVDDLSSRPFMITNQLEDVSLNGMRSFWQENGKLEFDTQFYKITGQHYPITSTSSPIGIGYMTTYDPRYKRLIVQKRDFRIRPKYASDYNWYTGAVPGGELLWFTGSEHYYNPTNGYTKKVDFNDPEFFENRSFTLSYSFLTKKWTSFHSYLPYYMFNNYETFFGTSFSSSKLYKHNFGNYTYYYGTQYPHIIDLIAHASSVEESMYSNIQYASKTEKYDLTTKQFQNEDATFNKAVFYNSKQISGIKDVILSKGYFDTDYEDDSVLVKKTNNKYSISNLRDSALDENLPLWTSEWNAIQSTPFNYIDKVPNLTNLDTLNDLFSKSRFRDYYLGVRLMYYPEVKTNYKLTTDIINTRYSNRIK